MSVTKLKTVGNWQAAYWQNNAVAEPRTHVRGRVITGMLTGGDSYADRFGGDPGAVVCPRSG